MTEAKIQLVLEGLSEVIKIRRFELDLSQEQLAKRAKCGRNYIILIETAKNRSISIVRLINLAEALDYSISDMFKRAEEMGKKLARRN